MSKLDYFVKSGIETLYITPHYMSPMQDNGYDISNFTAINPMFGTMEDFENLVAQTKTKGLKLLIDLVINHSSDEHPWFNKSIHKIDPYTDFYVWKNPKGYDFEGNPIPPNNWVGLFHGSAWEWNENRKQFYYHQFLKSQPDFNLRNKILKRELKKMCKFWLDKGVSGFRLDATVHFIEDADFRDEPLASSSVKVPYYPSDLIHIYTRDLWESYEVLHEFREFWDHVTKKFTDYERIYLPEAYAADKMMSLYYGTSDYKIVHFPLNFGFSKVMKLENATFYYKMINNYLEQLPEGATPSWNCENHDKGRKAAKFNADYEYIFTSLVLLLPGVSYLYYGQEIGMTEFKIRLDQQVDRSPDELTGQPRDPSRLPMQWDDSINAGFSNNDKLYLPVNSDYWRINVKREITDPNSHYNYVKRLLRLRKTDTLKYGAFQSFVISEWVFAFTRILENKETFLVVMNLGSETEMMSLSSSIDYLPKSMVVELCSPNSGYIPGDLVSTISTHSNTFLLRPFALVVLKT